MGVAATWLPPELWVIQPYSMGPLMGCPPDQSRPCPVRPQEFISPASGTIAILDSPELAILTCFVAPASVQHAAQKQGQRGIMMIRAPGLYEALGVKPAPAPEVTQAVVPMTDWERDQEARRAFAEALAALDDDDEE